MHAVTINSIYNYIYAQCIYIAIVIIYIYLYIHACNYEDGIAISHACMHRTICRLLFEHLSLVGYSRSFQYISPSGPTFSTRLMIWSTFRSYVRMPISRPQLGCPSAEGLMPNDIHYWKIQWWLCKSDSQPTDMNWTAIDLPR